MTDIERKKKFNQFAQALDKVLEKDIYGQRMGFIVIAFPFGEIDGRADYISNAKREDMIKFLKETVDRFEKGQIDEMGR